MIENAPIVLGQSPRPKPSCGTISTRELLVWAVILFGGESLVRSVAGMAGSGIGSGSWTVIDLIVWGCVIILTWRDDGIHAARPGQTSLVVAIMAASTVLSGNLAYGPLLFIGVIAALGDGWSENERRAGVIMMAIGVYRVLSKLIVMLFADTILRADTAIAGLLITVLVPGSSWTGNTIRPPHDVGITVAMACSSFANLSLVSLCYTSIAVLDGGVISRRNFFAVGGVWLAVISLNTVRLVLMARSLDAYNYWHFGTGATLFGVTISAVTAAMCSFGSKWANAR